MISLEQIKVLAKLHKIDESVIAREYIQLLFLNELYSNKFSKNIFFKGGTAIKLVYKGNRFSEDLDFTVNIAFDEFEKEIKNVFKDLKTKYNITVSQKETIIGKSYLLTYKFAEFKTDIFVKLDFSFRESVIEPTPEIIKTNFPIIINNFFQVLSKDELVAEKIRAIMTRNKLRDLYDLWVLLSLGAKINLRLIQKKLDFYQETFDLTKLLKNISKFSKKDFIQDLRPFVPVSEREKLADLFDFIIRYLEERFTK